MGKFFHLPKGKQFNIPYRFYDPRKEKREEREARIKAEMDLEGDDNGRNLGHRPSIKGSFKSGLRKNQFARSERKKSNFRLLLILAILALLAYMFLR
jgi:hypothetical protein